MKDKNMVSKSHFNMPEINMVSNLEPPSLPASYGKTSIFLMAVDPYSAHIIWEIGTDDMSRLKQKGGQPVIKLHDITANISPPPMARTSFEVKINIDDQKSYIALPKAGRTYSAELGFKNTAGCFFPLAQSNSAEAPRDTPAAALYPSNESADNTPEVPKTAPPPRQIPGSHLAAAKGKTGGLDQVVQPLENRVRFDEEAAKKYINAVEIINNPPHRVSFLPHMELEPSFTPFDYSSLHENPPREISHHGHNFDLTEFNERRFISGISSI